MADQFDSAVADLYTNRAVPLGRKESPLNFAHPIDTLRQLAALGDVINCWIT